jgi:hypothetical protein
MQRQQMRTKVWWENLRKISNIKREVLLNITYTAKKASLNISLSRMCPGELNFGVLVPELGSSLITACPTHNSHFLLQ